MLLMSFAIYPSFLGGFSMVLTAISSNNQKSKIETQVQTRSERSLKFKGSSSTNSEGKDILGYFLLFASTY